jgi:valyl-tRNA synthetase
VIPFVTEELWSFLPGTGQGLLAGHAYPRADESLLDPQAEAALARLIGATQALRAWRDAVEIRPRQRVHAVLQAHGYDEILDGIARLAHFQFSANGDVPIATIPIPGGQVGVLPVDLDLSAYEQRRARLRAQLEAEIARAESKLGNESFVAKARADVVAGEREKLAALTAQLAAL